MTQSICMHINRFLSVWARVAWPRRRVHFRSFERPIPGPGPHSAESKTGAGRPCRNFSLKRDIAPAFGSRLQCTRATRSKKRPNRMSGGAPTGEPEARSFIIQVVARLYFLLAGAASGNETPRDEGRAGGPMASGPSNRLSAAPWPVGPALARKCLRARPPAAVGQHLWASCLNCSSR